jgi:hypothetical protein
VSVATTLAHAKGGQFVTHVKALPGNPYDGHTLKTVIPVDLLPVFWTEDCWKIPVWRHG